jgi:hypothetical protein
MVFSMNSLVTRLSEGEHTLEASLRPVQSADNLKECIERGFVSVRFLETRGGTELGFNLDRLESDLDKANFDIPEGVVKLVGSLTLDYVKVRCVAEIDLRTLRGRGHLEPILERSA